MTKFYFKNLLLIVFIILGVNTSYSQQVPNAGFEDWSGAKFDGNIQPASWFASNVSQVGFNFNFAQRESGHSGSYSMMVQDKEVGAMGITETAPGYFSLGKPWAYLEGIDTKSATAGTSGGINFKYRPDSMSVWIKRTGSNTSSEDFHLLYYAWSGTAQSSKYKSKGGDCTSVNQTDEESDIRIETDGNECGTDKAGHQIAEGHWRERKSYGSWTNIRVPIYYFNSDIPSKMNIIFSAGNYPNFRANSGLYAGNSLYVDDVEMIYSSKIQLLYIGGKEWKGFNPNSSEEQLYSLGRNAETIPEIMAVRGAGTLTNTRGKTVAFSGRKLSGSEISIKQGEIDGEPTVITVKSEDGKSTSTYKIKFVRQASNNANLAEILINGKPLENYNPDIISYNVTLPYGTNTPAVVEATKAEDRQTIDIIQPTAIEGSAQIKVTAADEKTTKTYIINFEVGQLADNTLKDILINGQSLPGFTPNQTIYRVSLPTTTTAMPVVEAVSAYADGAQTIEYIEPDVIDGGTYQIKVTTPGDPKTKTYKLTFKLEASSYSLLKSLQMGDNLITDFNPEQTTYYVNLPIGTTQLPKITYELGESTQTVTIAEGGLNGVTKVTVVAGNKINTTEYKIVVATKESALSTLKMIYIDGEELPGFSPDKKTYNYSLPIGTTSLPSITVEKGDEYQTVTILEGGLNGTTRITVVAGNGNNSTQYQITFSVKQATNATLKMIYLDGKPLEGFDPNILEYNCPLPQGTTQLPVITYDKADEYQSVTTRDGGVNGDYKITVRPQSGAAQTYVLHFSVATSDNADLKMIYLDGEPLEGFDAKVFNYVDTLPMGVLTIPTVTYDKGDENQKVLNVRSNNTQTIKVTAESGRIQTYSIEFIIQRSNSAFLKMIYLDGDSLVGFDKNTFDYTVSLQKPTCPRITVEKEEGQQVTITTPYATGTAEIVVTPEMGEPNTYTIHFVNTSNNYALLKNIYVDGQAIEGFIPDQFAYSVVCKTNHPIVTYDKDSTQVVTEFRQKNIVTLHVVAGTHKAQYEIILQPQANSDCTLRSISMDGVGIAGFTPTTYQYTLSVPAETTTPNIGYEKQYAEQVVYAGMLNASTYSLLVAAQSGDTARYTLRLEKQLSDDANLINLALQGMETAIDFQPSTYEYTVSLPEGYELPNILVESKPDQDVALHSVSDKEQEIIVIAPSGKTNIYRIIYDRQKSSKAWLQDILINGTSLDGFDAQVLHYTDTLAWRTKVVPCVQPIGSHPDQTISTYHSQIAGITTISVLAADGITKQDYTIHFPVIKSSNTALEFIELDHETVRIDYNANVTDYHIALPYGETQVPIVLYQAMEPEQNIEYISRPLGQTSEITVTAEDGTQRTYKLHFQPTYASQANLLKALSIVETGATLDVQEKSQTIALPYGTRTMTVNYTKAFAEQTVWVQPGGVTTPTIITLKSNRPGEEDVIYTLTPAVETQDPAVLTDIKVNGATIEGFDANRFSYIANITQNPIIQYTPAAGALVNVTIQTNKHWQAQVTYQGRTNTYDVWYYYQNDQVPNTEFTEWTNCATYTSAVKPTGWNTIADVLGKHSGFGTFNPDGLVSKSGNDAVYLKTLYSSPGGGNIPGFITLGTVSGKWGIAGTSSFSISGGITFHNTPDQLTIRYYNSKVTNNSLIQYTLTGLNGTKTFNWTDSETGSNYKEVTQDLTEANTTAGDPSLLNITLCSYNTTDGTTGSLSTAAEMYVDWLRFAYNGTLTGLKVNDSIATMNGKAFSYTLPDSEHTHIPTLTFTGEVADQAQKVVWSDEVKEADYAVRNATITNYAEDGTSTEYTLQVKRPLDTKNTLSDLKLNGTTIAAFVDTKTEYTVRLASTTKHLPDVQPVAASCLQTITTSYADSTMTIVVTPESGEATTYTVRFITDLSADTELEKITVEGVDIAFTPAQKEYTVTGEKLPAITFVKKMDGQTVDMNNGILRVTAENGATGIYTILLDKPNISTTGQLSDIEVNGVSLQGFSSDIYEYTLERPESVSFKRINPTDSVVFIQTPEYMEWQVYGDEQHTYRITYPNTLSSNTYLKAIYIDSTLYQAFNPQIYDYVYATDSPVHIHAVANEESSQLEVSYNIAGDTTTYIYTVIAEDGTIGDPYHLSVIPNLSATPYLQSISLDGKPLTNFRADVLEYKVVLPTSAFKAVEPSIPTIEYQLGAPRQQAYIEHGALGETTNIVVISEDGAAQAVYQLYFEAEPSHCASLTGIAVNGEPIEHFESNRHYYSVKTSEEETVLTWSSNDNFQTVVQSYDDYAHTLHVIAQDGISTSDYIVEIYKEGASSDVTLANILLDGHTFNQFETNINSDLEFSPMQQRYNINLPSGSLYLPEVSVLLNSEGQSVDIVVNDQKVEIHVTAPDKVSKNTYTLRFFVPQSNNAQLQMIYLNTDSLNGFAPDRYNYFINLPIGQTTIPEIYPIPQESTQTIKDSITGPMQHTIYVTAEDGTRLQYMLAFTHTYSNADTLLAIYADGEMIEGFKPDSFYYAYTLPVGTEYLPTLSWQEADEWQTITAHKQHESSLKQITQIDVVAGSGMKNTYTVTYEIMQSDIDTLQMIYIGADSLDGFDAQTLEYTIQLAAGDSVAPNVIWKEGDTYQTVTSQTMPYIIDNKQIGWKVALNVLAQDGHSRTYTLYFLFSKILSANTDLAMIYLNGNPMSNFDPGAHTYYIAIPFGEERPSIHVELAEPANQKKDINHGDTTLITVTAEDTTITDTYTIYFSYQLSSYAYLDGIYQDGVLIDGFRPDSFSYTITLPYGTTTMPTFTYKKGIDEQIVEQEIDSVLNIYRFIVTPPNVEANPVEYEIAINIALNDDCTLKTLLIKGLEIGEFQKKIYPDTILPLKFHPDSTQYQLIYPRGTDSCELVTREDMEPIANDSNATIETFQDGITIRIQVNAQNGDSVSTYIIEQIIQQGSNTRLKEIKINGNPLRDFDPEILEYSYYADAAQPIVEAIPEDTTTLIGYGYYEAGEPYKIFVQAEDGSTEEYTINFMKPTLGSNNPQAHDVLMKHIKGTNQIAFATTRPNVYAAVYNGHGSLLFFEKVEISDQNDIVLITNADGREELVDVYNPLLTFSLPQTNQFYFYVFYENKERKIASGKLLFVK